MNMASLRKNNGPITPNLEELKQKNKSKSRRKPYSIPTTNPPTPKPHKAQITIKQNIDKIADQLHGKHEIIFCQEHHNQPAIYPNDNGTKKMCKKCYLLRIQDQSEYSQQIQMQKRSELDEFKGRIKGFGLKLQEASSSYRNWSYQGEQNFYDQKGYIQETFQNLRCLVEEKKRELINQLMIYQQMIKKSLGENNQKLEQIKSSIKRYIDDIDSNYQDIIESLSYVQFEDIIDRYNKKIRHLEENLENIVFETSLNAYIPKTQIEKYIEKAAVQIYPMTGFEEALNSKNKTLQRYTTQKNSLWAEYQLSQHHQNHQNRAHNYQSLNNKMSQHRESRDRYDLCGKDLSLGQTRGHTNKENYCFENNCYY